MSSNLKHNKMQIAYFKVHYTMLIWYIPIYTLFLQNFLGCGWSFNMEQQRLMAFVQRVQTESFILFFIIIILYIMFESAEIWSNAYCTDAGVVSVVL